MHYGAARASLTRTHKRITTMLGNTAYLLTEVNRLTMHGNFPNRSPVQVFGVIRGTAHGWVVAGSVNNKPVQHNSMWRCLIQ